MPASQPTPPQQEALRQVAGYLNFSSGASDLATLTNLNQLHGAASSGETLAGPPPWLVVRQWLSETLDEVEGTSAAFADVGQARRVLRLAWSELLPAYLDFHRDLLFHQEPEAMFNGFFMGRCVEAVLQELAHHGDDPAVVAAAIDRLNDFVGFRPVAQLENRQCEPYPHEWVRPIPVYIDGAGVAEGRYRWIIQNAIEILRSTDPEILRAAHFDLSKLSELCIDPRAYDFDHPVNRRPNYQFGTWDPHAIDGDGFYRRFVLQQVTLDALLSRADEERQLPRGELLYEAAGVLAGTMLMASGISGWGPAAYGSDVTLASLMAPIAAYRDGYYEDLLGRMTGEHAKRLKREQKLRRQPLGAARQHLNAALASQRAGQQQHVHLARLYARIGYPDAAKRQADTVNVASARMMCRIDCLLTLGLRDLRAGQLEEAAQVPQRVFDLIERGIQCGALVDPWNILGFGGNFTRFHGPESGIHDHRVDDLISLTEQLFGYMARVWSEAAARDQTEVYQQLDAEYRETAEWWRQFSAHTVQALQAADPLESYESAKLVARALRLWHRGGAAAGDVKFWAPHAELFDSPRAYALVIDALLERQDFVASMALLVHWLSHAERVGLRRGASAWPRLAERWLVRLRSVSRSEDETLLEGHRPWSLVRKFFDYIEANAESFWSPPSFGLSVQRPRGRDWETALEEAEATPADEPQPDEGQGIFDAAYEDMTYRDTTDDGFEGAVFDGGGGDEGNQDLLEAESRRLTDHLGFHVALARLWVMAADMGDVARHESQRHGDQQLLVQRVEALGQWAARAADNRAGLLELLDSVTHFPVRPGGADGDAMTQYDRRRVVRDALLERIIGTAVETSDARRLISGVLIAETDRQANGDSADADPSTDQPTLPAEPTAGEPLAGTMGDDDRRAVQMYAALVAGHSDRVRREFPTLLAAIRTKNLLYIPLSRGGDPVKIFVARLRQRVLNHLLRWLPRRGLFIEACQLIETARMMEQQNPVGPGAVTEFDNMFRVGFRSLVQAVTHAVRAWPDRDEKQRAEELIPLLESLTETLLASWLTHSRTLRLSALEGVSDKDNWEQLVKFVRRYGDPIFTQTFLQLGNVRAILHQGVGPWLRRLADDPAQLADTPLIEQLGRQLDPDVAARHLSLVFESILDHHAEYLDYSSTTTQSDRGELIYMFLDFLRLRVRYDRIAWNLRPVMWAHEILVRSGFENAAIMWRRSLSERIGSEADVYVARLRELQKRYAMRMPTVADRILERFVQPMTIDRMRALVEPAIRDAAENRPSKAFDLLEQEADLLMRHPTGVGLDLPAWLAAIEDEVEAVTQRGEGAESDGESLLTIPQVDVGLQNLRDQLSAARRLGRRLPYMK